MINEGDVPGVGVGRDGPEEVNWGKRGTYIILYSTIKMFKRRVEARFFP